MNTPTVTAVTALEVVLPGIVEPSGLLLRERELPSPLRGELLVQVEATGISFAEKSMRRGRYWGQPAFPFVPGYDLVGRVIAVGSKSDQRLVGTRVASLTKTGGWASHAMVAARDSVPVPAGLDAADVETVVVNGLTAWQMLHRKAKATRGQTVVVHGANSGVGGILVQLARVEGIRVIGTASPRHHEALRAAGVEPLDYNDPRLLERVLELSPGGVAAVFDNVGGTMVHDSYAMLARGGALVSYSIIADVTGVNGNGSLLKPFMKALARITLWNALPNGRRAYFYDIWAGHRLHPTTFRARLRKDLGRVFALLGEGAIKANIAATFPLIEVTAAMELAESRTINGKVILVP
jgi:NADPH:quinone reductase-like Zn-dependent oxidoreductase